MSNPAMNPEIFAREANRGGGSRSSGGSPVDELPRDLFDRPRDGVGAPSVPSGPATDPTAMSINGVLSASAVLMLLVLVAGAFAWTP